MVKPLSPKPVKEDVRKLHKELYGLSKESAQIRILNVPAMKFLVSSGVAREDFSGGVRGIEECNHLFICNNRIRSYTVKEQNRNFTMSPFELEWGGKTENGRRVKASLWVPDYVTDSELKTAMLDRLGRDDYPIFIEESNAGLCAQIWHTGQYDEVGSTLESIQRYIEERGYTGNFDSYKEIHMSHVNMGWPEKTSLIIRVSITE